MSVNIYIIIFLALLYCVRFVRVVVHLSWKCLDLGLESSVAVLALVSDGTVLLTSLPILEW